MKNTYSFEFFDHADDSEVEISADSNARLMDEIRSIMEEQSAEIRKLSSDLRKCNNRLQKYKARYE